MLCISLMFVVSPVACCWDDCLTVMWMIFITFLVSLGRDDAKCIMVTHVCLCVCPRLHAHLLHGPGYKLGDGRRGPLDVHYWADLRSVHGLRCCGHIAWMRNVSEYMLVLTFFLVLLLLFLMMIVMLNFRENVKSSRNVVVTISITTFCGSWNRDKLHLA